MKSKLLSIKARTKAKTICSLAVMLVTLALAIPAQAQLDPRRAGQIRPGLQANPVPLQFNRGDVAGRGLHERHAPDGTVIPAGMPFNDQDDDKL